MFPGTCCTQSWIPRNIRCHISSSDWYVLYDHTELWGCCLSKIQFERNKTQELGELAYQHNDVKSVSNNILESQ